jgi:hypothetical protein
MKFLIGLLLFASTAFAQVQYQPYVFLNSVQIGVATGPAYLTAGVVGSQAINLASGDVAGVLPILNGGTNNGTLPVTAGGVLWTDGTMVQNVGAGLAGQVLQSNAAASPSWVAATGFANPMTTAGDIIYENAVPAPARLPIGTAGQVLTTIAGLPSWQTPAAAPAAFTVVSTAVNYTALTTDNVIIVDTTSGDITITLPTVVGITGHQFIITKSSTDSNHVIFAPNGAETIAYEVTQSISAQAATVPLIADGVSNYIIQ